MPSSPYRPANELPENPETEELYEVSPGDEPSPFEDYNLTKSEEVFMADPTDTRDILVEEEKRRKKNFWLKLLLGLLALAALGALVFSLMNRDEEPEKTPANSPTASSSPQGTKAVERKPLLEQFPKAPAVRPGDATVSFKKDTFKASSGETLTIKGAKLSGAAQQCKVNEPTDFCIAGQGMLGNEAFDIYFLKDAAHSRLFENPKAFKKVVVPGAKAAGLTTLDMGQSSPAALVTVGATSGGWMLVGADDKVTLTSAPSAMLVK